MVISELSGIWGIQLNGGESDSEVGKAPMVEVFGYQYEILSFLENFSLIFN